MKKNIFNNKTNIKVAGLIILATMGTAMLTGCDTAPVIQDEVKLQLEEAETKKDTKDIKENAGDVGKTNNNEKDQDNKEEGKVETITEDGELNKAPLKPILEGKTPEEIAIYNTIPDYAQLWLEEQHALPVKDKIPGLITKQMGKGVDTTQLQLDLTPESDLEELYEATNLEWLSIYIPTEAQFGYIEIPDFSRFPKLDALSISYHPLVYDTAQLKLPKYVTSVVVYGVSTLLNNGLEELPHLKRLALHGSDIIVDTYEGVDNLIHMELTGRMQLSEEFKKARADRSDHQTARLRYFDGEDVDYDFITSLKGGTILTLEAPIIENTDWMKDLGRFNEIELISENTINTDGAKEYEKRTGIRVKITKR